MYYSIQTDEKGVRIIIKEIAGAFFASALISFISVATRSNGEKMLMKTIIGTVFGMIVILTIKIMF